MRSHEDGTAQRNPRTQRSASARVGFPGCGMSTMPSAHPIPRRALDRIFGSGTIFTTACFKPKKKISVASGSVERRVIRLVNPGMAESEMTSHTILLSFQLIQPGEVAPAHRHTMSAFRFILQGHGAYTNVDGQKMVMEDGDLILTPQGCWHEHAHEGDENMVWIDDRCSVRSSAESDFFRPVQRPLARERRYRSRDVFWRDPARWQRYAGNGPAAALPLARHLSIIATISARIRETVPTAPRWNSSILQPAARHWRPCHAACSCCAPTNKPNRTATPARASTTLSAAAGQRSSTAKNSLGKKATPSSYRCGPGTTMRTPRRPMKRSCFSMHDEPILKAFGLYREEAQS